MSERLLDVENEAMLKIVELEKQLMQTNKELDQLRVSGVVMETVTKGSGMKELICWSALPYINLCVRCAGGVRKCKLPGAYSEANSAGERPDNPTAQPPGTAGAGGPAGWRTRGSSTPERRRRWRSVRLCLPLPSPLFQPLPQVRSNKAGERLG